MISAVVIAVLSFAAGVGLGCRMGAESERIDNHIRKFLVDLDR